MSATAIGAGALILWRYVHLLSSIPRPPIAPFALFGFAGVMSWIGDKRAPETDHPRSNHSPSPPTETFALRRPWRRAALVAALALGAFATFSLPRLEEGESHRPQTIAWLSSLALLTIAVAPGRSSRKSAEIASGPSKIPLGVILLITTIAGLGLLLRTAQLGQIPFTLSGDEAAQGLEAIRVVSGVLANPFSTAWRGVPTMSLELTALSLKLFGRSIFALRLPWALIGAATVPLVYWLIGRTFGRVIGFVAAALLAVYHYPIHFSRLGSNQIADAFLTVLGLLALTYAFERSRSIAWTAVGACAGLSLYFYTGARFVPLYLALLVALKFLQNPRKFVGVHGRAMPWAAVAFLLVAGPMLVYASRAPDAFLERPQAAGILQSGWLSREPALRNMPLASVMADQFLRASLAFHYYADRTAWYNLGEPLLDPFFGGLLAVGLVYATLRALFPPRDFRLLALLIWWWGVVILGGVMTESPPSSQRLTALAVPACVFIALAMSRFVTLAQMWSRRLPSILIYAAGVGLFAAASLTTYFSEYTPRRAFGGPYAELATSASSALASANRHPALYLVGAPYVFADFPTFRFLAPNVLLQDLNLSLLNASPSDVSFVVRPARFLIVARRLSELSALQRLFPEGTTTMITRPPSNVVIGALFEVP